MKETSKAAIYLRLSREDGDEESSSIENQRQMLMAFIEEREDLTFVREYADDGCSGYTFERPAFRQMMEDSRGGKCYLFSTFAYCGGCGEMLYHRQDGEKHSWQCRNRNCSRKGNIRDDELNGIVFTTLKAHLTVALNHQTAAAQPVMVEEISQYQTQIRKIRKRIKRYEDLNASLDLKREQGIVDDSDFKEMRQFYQEKIVQANREMQEIKQKQKLLHHCFSEIRTQFQTYCSMDHLTREMLVTLAERVEVFPENKIRLHLRYSDLFRTGGDTSGTEIA